MFNTLQQNVHTYQFFSVSSFIYNRIIHQPVTKQCHYLSIYCKVNNSSDCEYDLNKLILGSWGVSNGMLNISARGPLPQVCTVISMAIWFERLGSKNFWILI